MSQMTRTSSVAVRNYLSADLDACRALWVELTEWHRHIYDSPSIGGADPGRQFDEHLESVGPEHVWVAEVDGEVVGLSGLIPGEAEAELEPLVVSEPYRGQGIGRLLVETVIEAAHAGGARHLKVRPVARNEAAIRVFYGLGFGILGHIELFMDFSPEERQSWRSGERIASRDFML